MVNQLPHHSNTLGTRASIPKAGPNMGSVAILLDRLGEVRVISVAGEKAIAASTALRPSSRAQAIKARVRLPPAESPATARKSRSRAPSGPFARIQR